MREASRSGVTRVRRSGEKNHLSIRPEAFTGAKNLVEFLPERWSALQMDTAPMLRGGIDQALIMDSPHCLRISPADCYPDG